MMPQVPPAADQTPYTEQNFNTGTLKNNNEGVPNFGRTNQENTIKNTSMSPNNIFRMKTGRDAYQQEHFVSVYDANFGGMLGTSMGLN